MQLVKHAQKYGIAIIPKQDLYRVKREYFENNQRQFLHKLKIMDMEIEECNMYIDITYAKKKTASRKLKRGTTMEDIEARR